MTLRVLLIEDNAANMELARYLLESHGFDCDCALTGAAGLRLFARSVPDIVLCDLQLPDMDGFEVLRRLHAMGRERLPPIVAVTAYAMVGDRERILAAGFDDYLSKPLEPERFAARVAALAASKAAGQGHGGP